MITPGSYTDWFEWHGVYETDPRFAARLVQVQEGVRRFVDEAAPGRIVVTDVAGGQGRCVLPVLDGHRRAGDVTYQLVELDPRNVAAAREAAARIGCDFVARTDDAGWSDTYVGLERADLIVMSGLLMHMTATERRATVRRVPEIAAPNARFLWSLRVGRPARKLAGAVHRAGFTGVTTARRSAVRDQLGEATLDREPPALEPGVRWFTFIPIRQTRRNKARVTLGRWRRKLLRQPLPE